MDISRRSLLQALGAAGIGTIAFQRALAAHVEQSGEVTPEMIAQAQWVADIELDEEERSEVAKTITDSLANAAKLRASVIDADDVPAIVFRPDFFYDQPLDADSPVELSIAQPTVKVSWSVNRRLPQLSEQELAFAEISDQASLLSERKISSRELTQLYLRRLKKYDPMLKCVVTLLEEHALEQADASDQRRERGESLGVLDGIPWVAKDLVAIPPWKTTWGAAPFKDQVRQRTATVAERLQGAGSVLLAKVTLGALAWGDKWFGGTTRNPWNPKQGSSGSSAGSASAVAAGLTSFALGSETLGSIVSPCRRCCTSGLRPTFGRVSRAGCMPLAWSMDKIGPIARRANDLAWVLHSIMGPDGRDPTLVARSFHWPVDNPGRTLRIGVSRDRLSGVESTALDFLQSQGATLVEVDLEPQLPTEALSFILGTEATTVFDDTFRQDRAADYGRWPSTFRSSQFCSAIQYLKANRVRSQLIVETQHKLSQVDVLLGANDLLLTNLTGHPSIVVACGSQQSGDISHPGVVKLTAAAYREEMLLHVGTVLQAGLPPTPAMPPLDDWLARMAAEGEGQAEEKS